MELRIIYEDDETKISILRDFEELIEREKGLSILLHYTEIPNVKYKVLIDSIIYLLDEEWGYIEKSIVTSSNRLPIVESNISFSFIDKFSELEEAFGLLSFSLGVRESIEEIEKTITNYYSESNREIYVKLYEKSYYGCDGFFALNLEDEILITPFAISENFREEEDN